MKNLEYDNVNTFIKPLYFIGICIVIGGCMASRNFSSNAGEL
ncbi:hypothetical protein [Viridibacillus soli]|nr:hypothetical protein [Viridibacillus soli]